MKSGLAVGRNYIDHLILRLFISFLPSGNVVPKTSEMDDYYNYLIHSDGPLATKPLSAQITGFINSLNEINTNYTDIQLHFYYNPRNSNFTSSGYTAYNQKMRDYLTKETKTLDIGYVEVNLVQAKSRGYIELNGTSKYGKPIIRPNYLTNEEDIQTIIRAIKRMLLLLNTKTFKQKGAQLMRIPLDPCDGLEYLSDDYWRCYIHQISYPPSHTVGTSKMGPDSDPDSVVDPRLKVRNIKGLRQIDCGM